MNALRFEAIDRLELVGIDPPVPGPDQVLIRTGAATICTSDLHDLHGNPFEIALPVVLGHEGAGTIAGLGENVTGFSIGDRVAAHPVHPCLTCETCASGMGHLCPNMSHFGLNMQGTFAGYFVARADRVRVLPDSVSFEAAALAEPVCVCLEALRQTGLGEGQRLLIIGDGPFGVIMARLAERTAPRNVVLAGHHPARLVFAPGATTVNLRDVDDRKAALRDANGGKGFDAAILAVGSREAFWMALDLLRPKGRLVVFAPMPGETPVDLFKVLLNELEIVGSVNDPDLLDEAIETLADPALAIEDLITHRFAIEEYEQAFAMAEGDRDQAMKVAFTFE
jgi:threonine dehydrogenase-like Zn-dependent dehydrogenase